MDGSIGYCSKKPDIKAFLELHVEQGPVLDFQQLDIGIVQGIVGAEKVFCFCIWARESCRNHTNEYER